MKTGWKILLGCAAAAAALYTMPSVTTLITDSQGHVWRVPLASSFLEQDDDGVTFTSLRSAYAIGKDAQNALHSYKESKCYGTTYYYDEGNDVSYSGVSTRAGMPSQVTYHYEKGNVCQGWSTDDEIAWKDGSPADVAADITDTEAMEKNWYVIRDGRILNIAQYYDFSRMVKQGVCCMQRTLIHEGSVLTVVDVQLLESGRIRVTIARDGSLSVNEYGRFTEAEVNGQPCAVVYYGLDPDEQPTVLYPVETN